MKSYQMYRFIPIMLLCVCLFTGGCSQNKDQPSATHNQTPATEAASHTDPPHRYLPRRQTAPKLLQQSITYTYSLYKDYSTFPLTSGDGTYQVGVCENVSDDRYTTLLSETFSVTLTDPLKPYLYPNQYVNFTADFLPVAKAEELADGASSDLDIISSVYNYIITHFTYDYSKASRVTSGYLPDIDEVFTSEKGICFDYAAVMTFLMIAVILVLMQKSYLFFQSLCRTRKRADRDRTDASAHQYHSQSLYAWIYHCLSGIAYHLYDFISHRSRARIVPRTETCHDGCLRTRSKLPVSGSLQRTRQ